jgi:hypothetical protein
MKSAGTTAYQYEIRVQKERQDSGDLFGKWWEFENLDLQNSDVERITPQTAASIILEYEWLGTMPPFIVECFGLYFPSKSLGRVLGGAIVFSQRMEQNLIDAGTLKSIIPDDALYLSRGACAYWTPKNSASNMISRAAKQMGDCTILAYSDPSAGEVGSIYQALNWHYLGQTEDHSDPSGFQIDGKFYSTRSLRMYSQKRVEEAFPKSVVVPSERKHRYVGVYGKPAFRRQMNNYLSQHSKPYVNR